MKLAFFYCYIFLQCFSAMSQEKKDYIKISQELLYAVRTDESSDSIETTLANAPVNDLLQQLQTEEQKKAFWLNIYNAYTQIGLKKDTSAYQHRNKFFSSKFILIAGQKLSLDLVEHGILRRSKWKYSLGYLNKVIVSGFEKKFRVKNTDYRIHFALNCGARSCPPIAFYIPEQIDKQLDLATKIYMKKETIFNEKNLTVEVPAMLSWFRGDFGGKKGILRLLRQLQIIPDYAKPEISWKKYDWDLFLKAFE